MNETRTAQSGKVAETFGKSVKTYHQEAEIQPKVAEGLMASLRPWKGILPDGPILEIGCGTGFLTEKLMAEFPARKMLITDLSREMLEFCEANLKEANAQKRADFKPMNAEDADLPDAHFSLIISNFAAQWFKDPALTLSKLSNALKPGGLLLFSFPGNKSFPEWYQHCLECGLPFTANPLPDTEEMVIKLSMEPVQVDYYENSLHQQFDTSLDFFRHLKRLGVNSSTQGKQLSARDFRLLNHHWTKSTEGKINIEWHIVYLAARKD
jgi:malonyl-CoA O-methyltransferase